MKRFSVIALISVIFFAGIFFAFRGVFFQNSPLISVIISGQNMSQTIARAIDSVKEQSFRNWELIVVDDASMDETSSIVSQYMQKDKRISLIRNKTYQGQSISLNQAIQNAKGKYIAFFDPQHTAYPTRLKRQYLFMEKNKLDLSAGPYDTSESKDGKPIFNEEINQDILKMKLFFQNVFPYSSSIVRKDFLLENDINYDPQYQKVPEYDLWLKIALKRGKMALMGGSPIITIPTASQTENSWLIKEKENSEIRKKLLTTIGFKNSDNLEEISDCDFYRQLIDVNNASRYVDPDFLNDYAVAQCIPSLKFVHSAWTGHLVPTSEKNIYLHENTTDRAMIQFVSEGVLLKWENYPEEYFKCEKNTCTLATFPVNDSLVKDLDVRATDLHVFLEAYATNPALLQMIQYAQLPRSVRKIIAWHRFPNRSEHMNLQLNNTREVPLMDKEGYWVDATLRMLKATKEEMQKDPNLMLVLHANLRKYDTVISYFLKEIPKERIRHIHLYEDGGGELFKGFEYFEGSSYAEVQEVLDGHQKHKSGTVFGLHHFYPTTIYLFEWKTAQKLPRLANIVKNIEHADIQDVDFDYYRRTLTQEQKRILYQLMGFDYDYWAKLIKGKKSVIFTMGFFFGNKKMEEAERAILRRLMTDSSFSGIDNPSEYVWLYKPHPSFDAETALPEMRKNFPQVIEIPPQIPFEIFVLADLTPTKVAGYSSSLFYVLDESAILYFIRRTQNDGYLRFLQEVKHLPDSKILDLRSFMKK